MIEEWRDIKNYEGLYQVSNKGIVRSLDRDTTHPSGKHKIYGKILSGMGIVSGYETVSLCKDSIKNNQFVHRVVAESFLGNSNLCVDHIDGNKRNNHINNLRYLNRGDNLREHFIRNNKFVGTTYIKRKSGNYWIARIQHNNKSKLLGQFYTREEASNAYFEELNRIKECNDE